MSQEWRYYNHALIPLVAPHEEVDESVINNKDFWKEKKGYPLFARWTKDFDCGVDTDWWYIIKDNKFDISELKAKRRYEINKGNKNFEVRKIEPSEYAEDITRVQIAAFSAYPEKYRPAVDEKKFCDAVMHWEDCIIYGAFEKENGNLQGYAYLRDYNSYLEFSVLKTNPEYEKFAINAAIVNKIVIDYNDKLGKDFYICDGSKSVVHESAFQDYLEKYFGFRKAYCRLRIKYRFPVKVLIDIMYPFRNIIGTKNKLASQITGLLKMEEIRRKQ